MQQYEEINADNIICEYLGKNSEFKNVRMYGTYKEPLFVLTDVASILGLQNITRTTKEYIEGEEIMRNSEIVTQRTVAGVIQKTTKSVHLLTEKGLYRYIYSAKSEIARQFRDFVYNVLNTLRSYGVVKLEEEQKKMTKIWQSKFATREHIEKKHGKDRYEELFEQLKVKFPKVFVYLIWSSHIAQEGAASQEEDDGFAALTKDDLQYYNEYVFLVSQEEQDLLLIDVIYLDEDSFDKFEEHMKKYQYDKGTILTSLAEINYVAELCLAKFSQPS